MNIAVCGKQVPNTAKMRIDPESNTLIREGVESILNPLDEFPLEAALRLRETVGGKVTVFSMGPPQAKDVIHKTIAMGADAGYLLTDKKFAGSDTWATSIILASVLRKHGPFDLILCGKQAIDGDTGQVGPGIAAHLNIPGVTFITDIATDAAAGKNDKLRVRRMLEEMTAKLEVKLPAVLTVLKEANEPRMPTLSSRLRAFKYETPTITADDLDLSEDQLGLSGSPTRVTKTTVPDIKRSHTKLSGNPSEIAEQLTRILHESSVP